MKTFIAAILSITMIFGLAACDNSPSTSIAENEISAVTPESTSLPEEPLILSDNPQGDKIRVRLIFEGGEAIVALEDNATARGFAAALPLTHTFEDFNSIEKICRLSEEIDKSSTERAVDAKYGDVTLYIPWNTLVFYYEDFGYHDNLIPIGHVESGMELLAGMGDEFPVTMELIGEDVSEPQQETNNIIMTAGETIITASLDNSETTQEFLATLPRTITMNRYADREYYGRMTAISENGESIPDFGNGDVTYYPAGPSFAVFFDLEDESNLAGLIRMGKITSDLSDFDSLGDTVEMLVEIAE